MEWMNVVQMPVLAKNVLFAAATCAETDSCIYPVL
jgi:hypothetical protein